MSERSGREDLVELGKEEEEGASSASPSHPAMWPQAPLGVCGGYKEHSLTTTARGNF